MPGVTSGQRLRARDVRVLGFVAANDGKFTSAEIQAKIPEATFHIRESLDRLVAFKKIVVDERNPQVVRLHVPEKREPTTRRRIPTNDPRAANSGAATALRSALASPFPRLRRAAVEVMRAVFLRYPTMTRRAERLHLSIEALRKLKIDFPECWEDAENRMSPRSIRT